MCRYKIHLTGKPILSLSLSFVLALAPNSTHPTPPAVPQALLERIAKRTEQFRHEDFTFNACITLAYVWNSPSCQESTTAESPSRNFRTNYCRLHASYRR